MLKASKDGTPQFGPFHVENLKREKKLFMGGKNIFLLSAIVQYKKDANLHNPSLACTYFNSDN